MNGASTVWRFGWICSASPINLPDPADTKFLHCALAAGADYLVTGNRRDFPDARYGVTRVVNAAELIDQVTLEI